MTKRLGVMRIPKFIDDTKFRTLAFIAVSITVIAAAAYYHLGCLTATGDATRHPSWWDCLYFSAVTITSMGTSDFSLSSVGRALQIGEVSVGLLLFGMVVAKMSSARATYLLKRLYSSDAQKRLVYFDDALQKLIVQFDRLSKDMQEGHAIQRNEELLAIWLEEVMNVCIGLRKYIFFESEHGTFFEDTPPRAVRKVVRRIDILCLLFASRWPKLVAIDRERMTGKFYRKRVRRMASNIDRLCCHIQGEVTNSETTSTAERAMKLARDIILKEDANMDGDNQSWTRA